MTKLHLIILLIFTTVVNSQLRKFPEGFKFGIGSSAYQLEGAWNVDGKGESIWDYMVHKYPSNVIDMTNGDDACNSYYLYKEDVRMLKSLGVDFYRFSISWPRILPTGFADQINEAGIRYYNNLIDELLANGIEPVVTLYHWDLPQPLQMLGGWTSEYVADYFVDYARVVFDNFADRVKVWITFNEPYVVCEQGYGMSLYPPQVDMGGIADYLCSKTILLAHAKTYRLFHNEYAQKYPGKVGMSDAIPWATPATDSQADIDAADSALNFLLSWFVDPIYTGDYTDNIKKLVAEKSKQQGFPRSRLPEFTEEEKELLKGTADFFGLNHYTTHLVEADNTASSIPSFYNDMGSNLFKDPTWKASESSPWLSVNPEGIRSVMNWIKNRYNNPEIMIFENGFADKPSAPRDDDNRVDYFRAYLDSLLGAILDDGCNVTAYTAWGLMDYFEWTDGFMSRFGVFEVDFSSPDKTRTERKSAKVYREVIRTKVVDYNYNPSVYGL